MDLISTSLYAHLLKVSGEYSMLILGAQNGLFDLDTVLTETLGSLRRAGADVIITYFTPRILKNLKSQQ
jgi:porphobilinogen synthase